MRRTYGALGVVLVLLACVVVAWFLAADPGAGDGRRSGTVEPVATSAAGDAGARNEPKPGLPEEARAGHPGVIVGRVVRGTPAAGVVAEVRVQDEKDVPDAVVVSGADGLFRVERVRVGP